MNMISDRICRKRRRIVIFQNADDVGVKLGTDFIAQPGSSLFRAEDEMNQNVGQGLRHAITKLVPPFQGLLIYTDVPGRCPGL